MLYFSTVKLRWRGWLWRRPYLHLLLDPAAPAGHPAKPLDLNPTMNVVQIWLTIIGTPERAQRLLSEPWSSCPSVLLEGQEGSYQMYTDPLYRPALDAWDTGMVTRRDILCWAEYISGAQRPSASPGTLRAA